VPAMHEMPNPWASPIGQFQRKTDITLFGLPWLNVPDLAVHQTSGTCRIQADVSLQFEVSGTGRKEKKLRSVKGIVETVAWLLIACLSTAVSPLYADTPDPAAMTADERRAAYESMSDEDRIEFRRKMREHYDKMSPEEKKAARQAARERYRNMTPEERKAAKGRARELYESLTPEDQQAARQKARERYQNMTPDERKAMKEKRNKQKGSASTDDSLQ